MSGRNGKRVDRNNKGNKQCGSVTLSPIIAVVGAVCLLFFLALLIISAATGERGGTLVICGIFCLLGFFMVLTVNWRIDYTPEGFVYRDMLRISHRYSYSQIKRIRYSNDMILFLERRIILVDSMAENGGKFVRIAAQYSKASFIDDSHSKLFGGNVANPGEFIFIYLLISLLPVALGIFIMYQFRDISTEELETVRGQISEYFFDEYREDGSRMILVAEGCEQGFYTWQITPDTAEYAAFTEDVQQGECFELSYLPGDVTGDRVARLYRLSGSWEYISLEEYNISAKTERQTGLLLCGVILGVWLLYIAVSSYIMCHGDKYPRLLRLFVRPEYIVNKQYNKHHKKRGKG